MRRVTGGAAFLAAALAATLAAAQDAGGDKAAPAPAPAPAGPGAPAAPAAPAAGDAGKFVTRDEYDRLRKEVEALKAQQSGTGQAKPADAGAKDEGLADELEGEMHGLKSQLEGLAPGTTKILLSGNGFAGIVVPRRATSSFNAGFELLPLVKITDDFFFEGVVAVDFAGSPGTASFDSGFAHLVYIVNDYIMLGAGLFPNPANKYHEVLDPAWLNKLPDDPLPLQFNLMPDTELGIDVRGSAPLGPMRVNYAAFVSNGATLVTDPAAGVPGTLDFTNFDDVNRSKAVGGRIGLLPLSDSSLEIGYGIEWSEVGAAGSSFQHAEAFMQSVDLDYGKDYEVLAGRIDVRAQWLWTQVSTETFDPDGSLGVGPISFANNRNGGYAQLSYRPSLSKVPVLERTEVIGRYAELSQPHGAEALGGGFNEHVWTIGLDYWFTPSIVAKLAYDFDAKEGVVPDGTPRDANAFLAQFAIGW